MRPTGKLHLGHLVGALENWKELQQEYECLFMLADWHALMSEYQNPQELKSNIIDNLADWLACGISPQEATIFIQSHVREHLELYMAFSLLTPLGLLERCPTYKEQLREVTNRDLSTYGFLGYPVLQAADILLYKAAAVPVGKDQLPHLELTRQIARKFNNTYNQELFPEPKALLTQTNRLLGLDGRKMSKSYNNTIALSEAPQELRKKVQGMFTDPQRIKLSDPGHPDKCNVCTYYKVFAPQRQKEVQERCSSSRVGCTECKRELAEVLIKFLEPLQKKRTGFIKDKGYLRSILREGEKKAAAQASKTMDQVKLLLNINKDIC